MSWIKAWLFEFFQLGFLRFDFPRFCFLRFGFLQLNFLKSDYLLSLGIFRLRGRTDIALGLTLFFGFDKGQFRKYQVFVHKCYFGLAKQLDMEIVGRLARTLLLIDWGLVQMAEQYLSLKILWFKIIRVSLKLIEYTGA